MPHRQTVDFLRRRYATAILADDMATACRLRARLDGVMNQRSCAPSAEPPQSEAAAEPAGEGVPRLRLVTPVTGLLEWSGNARR